MAKKHKYSHARKFYQRKKCGSASRGCCYCDGCKTTSSKCPNRNKARDVRHIEKEELRKVMKNEE